MNSLDRQTDRCSPDSTCNVELGWLSHWPLEETTITLYICPHCRFFSSQLVILEVQVEAWPSEDRAVALYSTALSMKDHSKRAELVKQSRTSKPPSGVQGTE